VIGLVFIPVRGLRRNEEDITFRGGVDFTVESDGHFARKHVLLVFDVGVLVGWNAAAGLEFKEPQVEIGGPVFGADENGFFGTASTADRLHVAFGVMVDKGR